MRVFSVHVQMTKLIAVRVSINSTLSLPAAHYILCVHGPRSESVLFESVKRAESGGDHFKIDLNCVALCQF
jgi:hypothetical protein